MVLNVCYYCTEQLAFKAITSVSCTSSISQEDECESRECLIHGLRESSHCIYLSGSKSYQIAVRDMKLFFPEGLCCAECQTLEEEEVGFCPFLKSILLCQSSDFGPAIPWLPSPYPVDNAFLLCFTSCWDFLLLWMSLSQCANFVLTQTVSVEKCFFRYVCSVTCAINSGGLRTDALEASFPHWANITLEAGRREAASLVIAETQPARGWLLPGFLT